MDISYNYKCTKSSSGWSSSSAMQFIWQPISTKVWGEYTFTPNKFMLIS